MSDTQERAKRERLARLLHVFDCEDGAPDDGSETPEMYAAWWEGVGCNRALYYRRADRILTVFDRPPDCGCGYSDGVEPTFCPYCGRDSGRST